MDLSVINGFLNTLTNPELWTRIAVFGGGFALIGTGLTLIVAGDRELLEKASAVVESTAKATPVGAAVDTASTVGADA